MSDQRAFESGRESADGAAIAGALRALPLVRPPADLWPGIARELRVRQASDIRRRRRWRHLTFAAAAGLLLAVALAWLPTPGIDAGVNEVAFVPAGADADPPSADAAHDDTTTWVARSQWLERVVQSPALTPVVLDGGQAVLELDLQARIGRIDAALSERPTAPALWQARVGALTELAELRWAARRAGLVSAADAGDIEARLHRVQ